MKIAPNPGRPLAGSSEWRNGWPTLAGATFGLGTSAALFTLAAGLFIRPLTQEFGWSTSQAAAAPIVLIFIAILSPFIGIALDRWGSRLAALLGLSGMSIAYFLLSIQSGDLIVYYAILSLIGVTASGTTAMAYTRGVATWFVKNTGTAFGVTQSGTSIVGIVVLPVVGNIVADHGWRAGFLTLGLIVALIGLPAVGLLYREKPTTVSSLGGEGRPVAPGFTLREAVSDVRFWLLAVSFVFASIPIGAILVHLQPILADRGYALATAATLGGAFAFGIGIGRLLGGYLLDRLWDYGVTAVIMSLAGAGAFALTVSGSGPLWFMIIVLVLVGLGQGMESDISAYFLVKLFGLRNFSAIFGVKSLIMASGISLGGFAASWIYETMGSYRIVGPIAAGFLAFSGTLILVLGLFENKRVRMTV